MTKPDLIKKMAAAGVAGQVYRDNGTLTVELADEAARKKFHKNVVQWGGFSCGHGGWVLREAAPRRYRHD